MFKIKISRLFKKNKQNGRSMIEMLGVLTIIAVLSAGALAGYSKAIFKHKTNQTIDIFQGVLQKLFEAADKGFGKGVCIDAADGLIQYGLFPDCQKVIDVSGNDACQLPIGTLWAYFCDEESINGNFQILFTNSKSCVAFASAGWENAIPIEWMSGQNEMRTGGWIRIGDINIYDPMGNQGEPITKVKMSDIIRGCQKCDREGVCDYYLVMRGEI